MCNLYSITTNQAAIAGLFRRLSRYVGNLPPMPGVFSDFPAPVIRNTDAGRELAMMRWGMPPPPRDPRISRLQLATLAHALPSLNHSGCDQNQASLYFRKFS